MRVKTKGQVTIPIEVREKLGLFLGTEVEFIVRGDSATLKKQKGNKKGSVSRGARSRASAKLCYRQANDHR